MPLTPVISGDRITSTAWNSMITEINSKVTKTGDIMTGSLTVAGGNWDPLTSEGDIKIGNSTSWLKIGVATGGGGEGHVRLYQGGTNKAMFIGTGSNAELSIVNGKVGIKTTSPAATLDVAGSTRTQSLAITTVDGVGNGMSISRNATTLSVSMGFQSVIRLTPGLPPPPPLLYNFRVGHEGSFSIFGGDTFVTNLSVNQDGLLTVNGPIHAGNSDMYFTRTSHNHSGFGNTLGSAAIENAKDFNALMILGRTTGADNGSRRVRLWDYLEVNGNLDVTGRIMPSAGAGNNGIIFPENAFGGGGDKASIQYITRGGESTTLAITNLNDGDDQISIQAGAVLINGVVTSSDERLKKNIEPLSYGLEQIKQLMPVFYDWKAQVQPKKNIGLIAQNVEKVINEAIYVNKKDADNSELCLSYNSLIPVIINAIKELDEKISALQPKIARKAEK